MASTTQPKHPLADALRAHARALEATAAALEAAASPTAADELVPVADCGLERAAVRRYADRLGVVRIGRRSYVRRSALLALADELAAERAAKVPAALPSDPKAAYRLLVGGRT